MRARSPRGVVFACTLDCMMKSWISQLECIFIFIVYSAAASDCDIQRHHGWAKKTDRYYCCCVWLCLSAASWLGVLRPTQAKAIIATRAKSDLRCRSYSEMHLRKTILFIVMRKHSECNPCKIHAHPGGRISRHIYEVILFTVDPFTSFKPVHDIYKYLFTFQRLQPDFCT